MIYGVHLLLYSQDPEADRAFFRDVLDFKSIDAGEGWLIFALPPAELGIHPGDGKFIQHHADHELSGSIIYLMCDNLRETIESLKAKGVSTAEIQEAGWGITTTVRLPSGGGLGLYEAHHPTAIHLAAR
jgi:hypothetical protein